MTRVASLSWMMPALRSAMIPRNSPIPAAQDHVYALNLTGPSTVGSAEQALGKSAQSDCSPIRNVVATLVVPDPRYAPGHLIDIGVGYLSINRGVPTLSPAARASGL